MRSPKLTRRSLGATSFLTLSFSLSLLTGCGVEGTTTLSGPTTGSSTSTLYFSAIPDANKTELDEGYSKVAAHLSKELGVPVKFRPASDYAASVEAFKNGDIQLAWFGGVTGVQARRAVPGARAIAQGKVDPQYVSYFIANASTGIKPSDTFPMGLAGKSFTFGPDTSTSGRVMPEHFIREATKKSPADFFGHPNKYTKGHDFTAKEVEAGTVDAGVVSYTKYDDMVAKGQLDPAKCVKIWTTPPYPDYNWTAHPSLDKTYGAGFTDKLQKALVGITDPELLGILLRKEGLIAAKNEDFEPTAKTMAAINM
jgi:phosphonate transport system substrate-binding protein